MIFALVGLAGRENGIHALLAAAIAFRREQARPKVRPWARRRDGVGLRARARRDLLAGVGAIRRPAT